MPAFASTLALASGLPTVIWLATRRRGMIARLAAAARAALEALQADYEARRGGFYLSEVAGGFQFRTRPEYNGWVRRLVDPKPVRLSKAALETLAIIAYRQPLVRAYQAYCQR